MKIVVIGKSGQLASELFATAPEAINLVCFGRTDIDLTSRDDISDKIRQEMPDVVINASAYTAVDKAETDVDSAFLLNATAVKYLVEACKDIQCRFIHVSTDFVFDGTKNVAYETSDPTNPIGVYGLSKLAGEQAISQADYENVTVVRTSWVYSVFGNNFVKTMLRLMRERTELGVVVDQIGCPTNAKGLACFLWSLSQVSKPDKIYHWSDLGVASWYDFAIAVQDISFEIGLLDKKISVLPIKTSEYPTPANRPCFSVLNTLTSAKLAPQLYWRDALRQTIVALNNKS